MIVLIITGIIIVALMLFTVYAAAKISGQISDNERKK